MNRTVEKLKAARAELRIRKREYNRAHKALARVVVLITFLEKKIELARNASKT